MAGSEPQLILLKKQSAGVKASMYTLAISYFWVRLSKAVQLMFPLSMASRRSNFQRWLSSASTLSKVKVSNLLKKKRPY